MSADVHDWRARQRGAHAVLAGSVLVCGALALHPALAALTPACPIYEWFGVLCPGCGATRAVLALLHGRMGDAWRWKPLFVALLPVGLWFMAESYRRAVQHREFRWPEIPVAAICAIAVAGCVFTIVRNLA
jgi:peptidoglycan/LPS O-acetylase OafA/YrhL